MPLTSQKLAHTIFHRDRPALHATLAALNEDDLQGQPSPIFMREHAFRDSADNAKNQISFLNLLTLLHKHELHDQAEELLNRFHHTLDYHELVGALRLQITNKQFDAFKRAYASYGENQGVFTQLATDILLLMPRTDAETLFSANKNHFFITRLTSKDDYRFLKRFGWHAPTQAILLEHYHQFSSERVLDFLKSDPGLLYDIIRHTQKIKYENFIFNLLHLVLRVNDVLVIEFLLKHAPQLAVDYHTEDDQSPQSYWLLPRSLPAFSLILWHENTEKHDQIKRDFYHALFSGVIGNILMAPYAYMNQNRNNFVKTLSSIEDEYFWVYGQTVKIIEEILVENDEIRVDEITALIKESALSLRILHAAMIHHATRLVRLIANNYQKKPIELLLILAPCSDLTIFKNTLNKFRQHHEYQDILIHVLCSLLFCQLDAPILLMIKYNHAELFKSARFNYWLGKCFNPKILLACLRLGLAFPEEKIIKTAAFAWMTGNKDDCAELMALTSQRNNDRWLAMQQSSTPSMHNRLWENTPSVVDDSYGYGFTQDHYKTYQLKQAQLICFYFYLKNFSFDHLSDSIWSRSMMTFYFLGTMRLYAATVARGLRAESFGKARGTHRGYSLLTPIVHQYASYQKQLHQQYLQNPDDYHDAELSINKSDIILNATVSFENNKNIPLTKYEVVDDMPVWQHTSVKYLFDMLKVIQKQIADIVRLGFRSGNGAPTNKEIYDNLVTQVGAVHWLLAHAVPMMRGSASITESICAGLMMYLGHSITYTHQVDCEALVTASMPRFQKSYATFFSSKPIARENHCGTALILALVNLGDTRSAVIRLSNT